MTTDLLASLVDSIITISAGIFILLYRRRIVARIVDPKKKSQADTALGIGASIVIICAIFLAVGKIASHEDYLSKLARQANLNLPKLVEPGTRLERVSVEKPRRLIYHLTALSGLAKDVDRAAWKQQKVGMEAQVRSNADVKKMLNAGITLVYRYSDQGLVFIDEIVVAPTLAEKK